MGYSDAFRTPWLSTIPFGAVGSVVALLVQDVSPYFTQHTAVSLQKERPKQTSSGAPAKGEMR